MRINLNLPTQSACVHYRVSVIEAGREVLALRRKRNLILDQGLNELVNRQWYTVFSQAVAGTGTTPTKRDSGATTFTRSGTTVTASASFFEAADVGRLLKFDTGEEMYVTGFTDSQTVTVGTSGTIGASEGTVWYVNQTALTTETKRTGTFGTDGGDNGSTYTADTLTMKRTLIFGAETGTVNYREIGWSWTNTPGANLFGRDLLDGAGVTLVSGQQLKVVVELSVAFAPATPTAWTNPIVGWTQPGSQCVEAFGIRPITATGNADPSPNWDSLEPSIAGWIHLSTVTTALAAPAGTGKSLAASLASKAATNGSYSPGSFTRKRSATFGVTEANSTAIRSLFVAFSNTPVLSAYRVLLNAAETKDSNHRLDLEFTISWGRTLTN